MFRRSYNSDLGLEAALVMEDGKNSDLPRNARCDLIKINKHKLEKCFC